MFVFLCVTSAVFMHRVLSIVCAVALVLIMLPNVNFLRLMFVNKSLIFGKNENSPYCTFTRIKNHCSSDVFVCDIRMNTQLCGYAFYAACKCFILPLCSWLLFFAIPVIYSSK